MSRASTGEVRTIAPSNNIYTAISAGALVIVVLGIVALVMKAGGVGGLLPQ